MVVDLAPERPQIGVYAESFRRADDQGKNHMHGGQFVWRVGRVPLAFAAVEVVNVIFAVVTFFEVGEVAVKFGHAFDDGIGAITQPAFVESVLVALPIQAGNARAGSENVGCVTERTGPFVRDYPLAV